MAHQTGVVVTFTADASQGASRGYGESVAVTPDRVAALTAERHAVVVDVRKLGRAQRRLLLHLRCLERELLAGTRGLTARRLRRPGAQWSITEVQARETPPAARPVYTAALAALASRGLVVRLDRTKAPLSTRASHTRRAQLSEAGRWVARELVQDIGAPAARLEAIIRTNAADRNS